MSAHQPAGRLLPLHIYERFAPRPRRGNRRQASRGSFAGRSDRRPGSDLAGDTPHPRAQAEPASGTSRGATTAATPPQRTERRGAERREPHEFKVELRLAVAGFPMRLVNLSSTGYWPKPIKDCVPVELLTFSSAMVAFARFSVPRSSDRRCTQSRLIRCSARPYSSKTP